MPNVSLFLFYYLTFYYQISVCFNIVRQEWYGNEEIGWNFGEGYENGYSFG